MRLQSRFSLMYVCICVGIWFTTSYSQGLVYDPEKGIIFSDSEQKKSVPKKKVLDPIEEPSRRTSTKAGVPAKSKSDIHVGRQKDPPELYYTSGLEYFKNGDYRNSLKNFTYADSVRPHPLYKLWIGKTQRQLGDHKGMLETMQNILKRHANSDVADDALFEMALYYQGDNDYETATRLYTQLAEQYPFGKSASNGEEFMAVAREQRRLMRGEIINILSILGYAGDDLTSGYSRFQKKYDLTVTGTGTRETVSSIKEMHQKYLEREENREKNEQQVRKILFYALIAGGVGCINLLLLLLARFRIKSMKLHLCSLRQILTELEIRKLS